MVRDPKTEQLTQKLLRAKIRNVTAQAEKTELKTQITQGNYVKIEDVKKKWGADVMKVRNKLLGLHITLASRLENVSAIEASAIIKAAVMEALNELAGEFGAS